MNIKKYIEKTEAYLAKIKPVILFSGRWLVVLLVMSVIMSPLERWIFGTTKGWVVFWSSFALTLGFWLLIAIWPGLKFPDPTDDIWFTRIIHRITLDIMWYRYKKDGEKKPKHCEELEGLFDSWKKKKPENKPDDN